MRGPTIAQCSRALGIPDSKFISTSLKASWSPSNPDFSFADKSDEYLYTVANDYIRDKGPELWGNGDRELLYPDDIATIRSHLVGILNRHRVNEHDTRVRLRRQGSGGAEDSDGQSSGTEDVSEDDETIVVRGTSGRRRRVMFPSEKRSASRARRTRELLDLPSTQSRIVATSSTDRSRKRMFENVSHSGESEARRQREEESWRLSLLSDIPYMTSTPESRNGLEPTDSVKTMARGSVRSTHGSSAIIHPPHVNQHQVAQRSDTAHHTRDERMESEDILAQLVNHRKRAPASSVLDHIEIANQVNEQTAPAMRSQAASTERLEYDIDGKVYSMDAEKGLYLFDSTLDWIALRKLEYSRASRRHGLTTDERLKAEYRAQLLDEFVGYLRAEAVQKGATCVP